MASFFGLLEFIEGIKIKNLRNKEHFECTKFQTVSSKRKEIKRIVSQIYNFEKQRQENIIPGHINERGNVVIYITRKRSGLPLEGIGTEFGLVKYSSVNSIVCRTKQQHSKNKKLRNLAHKVKRELKKTQAKICPLPESFFLQMNIREGGIYAIA